MTVSPPLFLCFFVPELYRKLRETRGINFHQVSSIYVWLVSSYDQKTEKLTSIKLTSIQFWAYLAYYPLAISIII